MPEVALYDNQGSRIGTAEMTSAIFGVQINQPLLHQVVCVQLANRHQGTASALTRGEVRRGGSKVWRQKGTGRARHGSRAAPLWVGGGIAFPPRPGRVKRRVPRQMRRQAFANALSLKVAENALLLMESLALEESKTRAMVRILSNMGIDGRKVLLVLEADDAKVQQAAANIPDIKVQPLGSTSVVDLLTCDFVVMTKGVVTELERRFAV